MKKKFAFFLFVISFCVVSLCSAEKATDFVSSTIGKYSFSLPASYSLSDAGMDEEGEWKEYKSDENGMPDMYIHFWEFPKESVPMSLDDLVKEMSEVFAGQTTVIDKGSSDGTLYCTIEAFEDEIHYLSITALTKNHALYIIMGELYKIDTSYFSRLIDYISYEGEQETNEFDISQLSYDQLVSLKDEINLAIWNSKDWQEVSVPKGVWVVGEDIPAGKWEIRVRDGIEAYIKWGDKLDKSGLDYSYSGNIHVYELLQSPTFRGYVDGETDRVIWDLIDGTYFIVESGDVIFTPYSGKPSLGFK